MLPMSTATLHPRQQQQPSAPNPPRAASAQGHRQFLRASHPHNTRSASHPHPSPSRHAEKEQILKHAEQVTRTGSASGHGGSGLRRVMAPEEVSRPPEEKRLGQSSSTLRLQDFELMRTLGTGTFARVWLCRFAAPLPPDRNKVFALKVLKKVDVIKLKQVEHVRNERDVLAAVAGHPFITTLVASFSDETSLYMLLDYTPGGEIFSYLRRARRFPFSTVQFYAAEITLILAYLHEVQFVAYRDLKPENILLDVDGHLKLVDFGFAKYLPPDPGTGVEGGGEAPNGDGAAAQSSSETTQKPETEPQASGAGVTYTLCGTPEYLAPEVIRNTGHGTAVDWWALGILVYEMLIGQPPFWDQNPMRIYEQIVAGHIRFPTSHSQSSGRSHSLHVPRPARDFILALCKTDPTQRLGHIAGGSKRVMSHYFFDGLDWDEIYYRKRRGPIIPRVEWDGDAGNFDEYPDPVDGEESEGGRGRYTEELREEWEASFADF